MGRKRKGGEMGKGRKRKTIGGQEREGWARMGRVGRRGSVGRKGKIFWVFTGNEYDFFLSVNS